MAIDNELSSEIAAALLTGKEKDPKELNDLKEIVLRVHRTLQRLSAESRRSRGFGRTGGENEKAIVG